MPDSEDEKITVDIRPLLAKLANPTFEPLGFPAHYRPPNRTHFVRGIRASLSVAKMIADQAEAWSEAPEGGQ